MGRFDSTKTAIDVNITQNGNQEITGSILNSVLNNMVDATDAQLGILQEAIPTKLSDLEQDIPIGSYDDTEIRQELSELSEKVNELDKGEAYIMGDTLTFRNWADASIEGETLKL